MQQKITFECSPEEATQLINLLKLVPQLVEVLSPNRPATESSHEKPLKRGDIINELKIKESTFFNWQKRGLLTPHRLPDSRLTFYYLSEVLAALKKFNPGKYHDR